MKNRVLILISFVTLLLVVACQSSAGTTQAAPAVVSEPTVASGAAVAAAEPAPGSAAPAGGDVAQAGAVAADRYPALLFGLLEPDERARFVGLAEAELCPCDGQVASLDACLRTVETTCSLAAQVAAQMMRMIKEDADDAEIGAEVQRAIANARRVHTFDLSGVPYQGAETPAITLVEFADFQCPHCREFAHSIDAVLERFGDRVRVYYRQYPLPSHPNAMTASLASLAAHRQGMFWQFHAKVFENQAALNAATDPLPLLLGWAEEIGLNTQRLQADMADPAVAALVQADLRAGTDAGLQGTPTLFIDGVQMLDGYTTEELVARIEQRLAAP